MIFKEIDLQKEYGLGDKATLTVIVPRIETLNSPNINRPALLTVPGGGYLYASQRDADPVVVAFMKERFVGAILRYTCKQDVGERKLYPTPIIQLMAAVHYLRKHASELCINPDQIILAGFSAGGHLAGIYPYLAKREEFLNIFKTSYDDVKPNALILGYPVITFKIASRGGSRLNLTNGDESLDDLLSIENNVDKDYPMTFVWNTKEDTVVPQENTTIMYDALKKAGVTCEMRQYEHGIHGNSTADRNIYATDEELEKMGEVTHWVEHAANFIRKNLLKI